ncbi:MAG: hypothetical protein HY901_25170 [Deltaproteobacteria bacterium]|nr:hypothetical protein [Deltaproteobacteria bacterium]
MTSSRTPRFSIRFDPWYRCMSRVVLVSPDDSYLELEAAAVRVRMGWAFRASFPRKAIVSAAPFERRPLSRGVHGLSGRWLVNGSGEGILRIALSPAQRGWVMGFPVSLKELLISLDEPAEAMRALTG